MIFFLGLNGIGNQVGEYSTKAIVLCLDTNSIIVIAVYYLSVFILEQINLMLNEIVYIDSHQRKLFCFGQLSKGVGDIGKCINLLSWIG